MPADTKHCKPTASEGKLYSFAQSYPTTEGQRNGRRGFTGIFPRYIDGLTYLSRGQDSVRDLGTDI